LLKKYANIPVFIPEMACPHKCIYCNQQKITGIHKLPSLEDVKRIIDTHLETLNADNTNIEVAFFGGNFTGIPIDEQKNFLAIAHSYIISGKIKGVRISTRPDYIDNNILHMLKSYGVSIIELGVQSMDADVLIKSSRAYMPERVNKSAALIIEHGFELGLQMMLGLPGDTLEKTIKTAQAIVNAGASTTRIYPLLVIKDTPLETMYAHKEYKPLTLEEAVNWSVAAFKIFISNKVKVIKMGLHPSKELIEGKDVVAGPFHQSFSELVLTEFWRQKIISEIKTDKKTIEVFLNAKDYNHFIGYRGVNKKFLQNNFQHFELKIDNNIPRFQYHVVYSK